MLLKKTLPIITILVAIVSFHLWATGTNVNRTGAQSLPQTSPAITFDRASIYVVEPDAGENAVITLNVVINRAPAQGEEAKVAAVSADACAVAGVDYQAVVESLTFPVGSPSPQSFEVVILGNNIPQPDREFVVFLTNPVNATVRVPGAITIHIIDNDASVRSYLPIIRGGMGNPYPGGV